MAISTYDELKTAVQSYLDNDDTEVVDNIDNFILTTESRVNQALRVSQMAERWIISTDNEYESLPPDFLEFRRLHITVNGDDKALIYYTPEQLNLLNNATTGEPYGYTIVGNLLQFIPAPNAVTNFEATYYAQLPALSATNTTNWLLTNFPDIYLNGCLSAGYRFLYDEMRAQIPEQLFASSIDRLMNKDEQAKYSGSTLTVRIL